MEEIIEEIPLTPLEPAKIYVHHFDKNTKEYLYKEEAEIDKQATKRLGYNVPLLPAYATLKLVPEYGENEIPVYSSHTEQQTVTEQIPVYDEETGEIISYQEQEKITDVLIEEWTLKPDYRKNFYKVDDKLNVLPIDTIGEQEGFYLVDKSTGDLIKENPDKYKISDGNVVAKTDEEYLQEQTEKERQRLNLLSMTRGDMFEAIILAFGKTKADIRSMIENVEGLTDIERALYLNRFDEALDFYRGYPAVDLIGQMLGVSFEQLDKFFETNDYKYLTAVTLTINPTPADATVTINSEAKNTVTVPYGDTVEYSVAAEGYLTQSGTVEPTEDTTLEVELVAEVVEPEPPVEGTDEVENADTTDTED